MSQPQQFTDADLTGARFVRADLSGAVMRGVAVDGLDIDDPLLGLGGALWVNGVDVAPLVESELNRRFPGRELRGATDPAGLREAWAAVEATWAETLGRAATLPEGAVDEQVDGEWSFAETLRHLVMATDVWFGGRVLEVEQPFHPLGMPFAEYASDGFDMSPFALGTPPYAEVLEARAERVAMVRDYLVTVTEDDLAQPRTNPWGDRAETVRSCLHVVLREEWEHHRYAVRDLEVVATR